MAGLGLGWEGDEGDLPSNGFSLGPLDDSASVTVTSVSQLVQFVPDPKLPGAPTQPGYILGPPPYDIFVPTRGYMYADVATLSIEMARVESVLETLDPKTDAPKIEGYRNYLAELNQFHSIAEAKAEAARMARFMFESLTNPSQMPAAVVQFTGLSLQFTFGLPHFGPAWGEAQGGVAPHGWTDTSQFFSLGKGSHLDPPSTGPGGNAGVSAGPSPDTGASAPGGQAP